MKIYGVIMAGGGGTRFWPLSRNSRPKQLLNLSGKDLMINETVDRLLKITAAENIYIVTNAEQVVAMKEAVNGRVPFGNILSEPAARNTSACIGYAAARILKERGDGVMVVTPSDAYIKDEEKYAETLLSAAKFADSGNIVTIGISPTFPATGYGYINFEKSGDAIKKVNRFVEKPDYVTAERYLKEGGYVWNSGIFVWKASVAMEKIKTFLPDVYSDLTKIAAAFGSENETETLNGVYPEIRSISIDYGVMEKTDNLWVTEGDFGWSDVGSWDTIGVLHKADENGNITVGDCVIKDCENSTVYADGRTVAVLGLRDVVVVETADAVLVCSKDQAQNVKSIVEELKNKGKRTLL